MTIHTHIAIYRSEDIFLQAIQKFSKYASTSSYGFRRKPIPITLIYLFHRFLPQFCLFSFVPRSLNKCFLLNCVNVIERCEPTICVILL